MKIIATMRENRYLLEATADEIAQVVGERYATGHWNIGTEIRVGAIYARLRALDEHKPRLERVAAELRFYADQIALRDETIADVWEEKP